MGRGPATDRGASSPWPFQARAGIYDTACSASADRGQTVRLAFVGISANGIDVPLDEVTVATQQGRSAWLSFHLSGLRQERRARTGGRGSRS